MAMLDSFWPRHHEALPWQFNRLSNLSFEFFLFVSLFFVHPTIDKVDRNDWRGYFPNTNKTNNNKQTKNKFTVTSLRVLVQPRAKYIAEERRLRNRFAHARNLLLETKCVNSIAGSWRTRAIHCIPIIFDIIALFLLIYFSPYGVAYLYYKNSAILHSLIVYSVFKMCSAFIFILKFPFFWKFILDDGDVGVPRGKESRGWSQGLAVLARPTAQRQATNTRCRYERSPHT